MVVWFASLLVFYNYFLERMVPQFGLECINDFGGNIMESNLVFISEKVKNIKIYKSLVIFNFVRFV